MMSDKNGLQVALGDLDEVLEGLGLPPGLEDLVRDMGNETAFVQVLREMTKQFETKDPEQALRYFLAAQAFAGMWASEILMWHVRDHEGCDCVREGLNLHMDAFRDTIINGCRHIAEREKLKDPFRELTTNEKLAEELLQATGSIEDECTGDDDDPSPWCQYCGAMDEKDCDCGPIADNH